MTEETLGTKRLCQSCAAKYYDFDKSPAICPSCGTEFDPEAVMRSRRGRVAAAAVAASKEDAESESTALEDAPELENDGDDVDVALEDDDAALEEGGDDVVDVEVDDVELDDDFADASDDGTLLEDDDEDLADHGLSEVEFGDSSEEE